jgi:hypothetical protein
MNTTIKIGRLHPCRRSGQVRLPPIRKRAASASANNNLDSSNILAIRDIQLRMEHF